MTPAPTKAQLAEQQRKMSKEIRRLNRIGTDDMIRALELLREVAPPPPASLPTRQQRRAAERAAQKAGRHGN